MLTWHVVFPIFLLLPKPLRSKNYVFQPWFQCAPLAFPNLYAQEHYKIAVGMDIPIFQLGREEWTTLFERGEDLSSDYVRALETEAAFDLKD